jgi:cysteine desulfurase/selenocysteine lyase
LALRGGHHCTQPLLRKLGVPATTRASFYLYNTAEEVDRLAAVIGQAARFFGV